MSNFRTWSLVKLNKRFGLKRQQEMREMQEWESADYPISEFDRLVLAKIQRNLKENLFSWNEAELAQHFIGPVFTWAEFTTEYFNIFNERPFGAVVDGEELNGEPDAIIASGHDEPEKPYFCFQEYNTSASLSTRKELDSSGDPAGQCLAAMLAAQEINEHKHPIFGLYVVGQNWSFMVLKGKEYVISPSFSAISDEIYLIFQRLLWLKTRIAALIEGELRD